VTAAEHVRTGNAVRRGLVGRRLLVPSGLAFVALAAVGLQACGDVSAGGPTGPGGQSGGGVSGSGGFAGSGGGDVAIAPGTCGVSRRVPLPGAPLVGASVYRRANGFVIGPWNSYLDPLPLHWEQLDGAGMATDYAAGGDPAAPLDSVNVGAADQLVAITVGPRDPDSADGDSLYQSVVLRNGQPAPTTAAMTLLSAFFRGTIRHAAAPALDGQQGLFMVGHVDVADPKLVVVGPDGAPVGDAAVMATSGTWDCDTMLPTAHAGAFAIVDKAQAPSTDETLHLLEMAPTGGVALELRLPLPRIAMTTGLKACPLIAQAATGFAILNAQAASDGSLSWHLYRVDRDGTTTDEAWGVLPGTPVALAIMGDSAVVLCLEADRSGIIVKRTAGGEQTFPLAAGDLSAPIRSEAGTLFMAGHVQDTDPPIQQLTELRCP